MACFNNVITSTMSKIRARVTLIHFRYWLVRIRVLRNRSKCNPLAKFQLVRELSDNFHDFIYLHFTGNVASIMT